MTTPQDDYRYHRMKARTGSITRALKRAGIVLGIGIVAYVAGLVILGTIEDSPRQGSSSAMGILAPGMILFALVVVLLVYAGLKAIGALWDGMHGGFAAEAYAQAAAESAGATPDTGKKPRRKRRWFRRRTGKDVVPYEQ